MINSMPAMVVSLLVGASTAVLLSSYLRPSFTNAESNHEVMNLLQRERLSFFQKLQMRLEQAHAGITAFQYIILSMFCGITMYLLCSVILRSWWLSLPTLFAGIMFAERLVNILMTKKKEQFEEGNIRALRIMASSLRTSPSYLHAFQQVADSSFVAQRVSHEYKRVVDLLRGQIPLETAMKQMYLRTGSADISYLATIVQVQRELGGDMAKTLDLAASFIVRRRQMHRKQRATMSQILSQVNLLSLMPFVFVISLYMNNPKHFDPLVETMGGRVALLGSFLSILIGGELIRYAALQPMRKGR